MTRRKSSASASRRQVSTPKAPISTRSAVSTRKRARQASSNESTLSIGTTVELQEVEGGWVSGIVKDVRPKFSPDFSTTDMRRKRKRLRPSRAKAKGKAKQKNTGSAGGSLEPGCYDTWILVETADYREWVLYEKEGLLRVAVACSGRSTSSHNTRSKGGLVPQTPPAPVVENLVQSGRKIAVGGSVRRGTKRSRRKLEEEKGEEEEDIKKKKVVSSIATRSSRKAASGRASKDVPKVKLKMKPKTPAGLGRGVEDEKVKEEEGGGVEREQVIESKIGDEAVQKVDEKITAGQEEVGKESKKNEVAGQKQETKKDGGKNTVAVEEKEVKGKSSGKAEKDAEPVKAKTPAKAKGKTKVKANLKASNGSRPAPLPAATAPVSSLNQNGTVPHTPPVKPPLASKPPVVDLTSIKYERIVPPHNVAQLAEQLGKSLSQLFKELGLVGPYEKAAYSWSSYKLCPRANTITAGIVLSEWFHKHIDEAVTCLVVDETARLNWVNEFKSKINGRNSPTAKLLHVARVFTIYPGNGRKRYKLNLTTENSRTQPWKARIFAQFEFESRTKEASTTEILIGEFRSAEQLTMARKLAMKALGDFINGGKNITIEAMRKVVNASVAGDRVPMEITTKRRLREKEKVKASRREGKPKSKQKKKETKSGGERRSRKQDTRRRREDDKARDGSGRWRLRKRKDAVESETRTEWLGEGYPGASVKGRGQKFYTGFRFTDNQEECRVLDHVLVYREDNVDTDSTPPKTNEIMAKDYYVGQIEALWEEPDASRHVRIAWFYWPEETEMGRTAGTSMDEVFCSSEVDTNPLSAISCKIKVVSFEQYQSLKRSGASSSRPTPAASVPSPLQDDAENTSEMEKGAQVRLERLVLLKAFQESRTLFARHFYNHKSALLEGLDHASRKNGTGKCPWLHSFLFATQQAPDVSHLLSQEDLLKNLCRTSRGVVDIDLEVLQNGPDQGNKEGKRKSKAEEDFEAQKAGAGHCSYCYQSLYLMPAFKCAVCSGVVLCIDCFTRGRQGAVGSNAGSAVQLIHKASHPYRVSRPQLSLQEPGMGVRALDYVVSLYGGLSVHYELVSIVRGPLASKEHRGPAPRFCYGLRLEPHEENDVRGKGRKLGSGSRTLGKAYGRTVEEARGLVALSALQSVFGIGNELSMKILGLEWTAFEALRLLDSIGVYGLAWEPAATIVGTKSVLQGRDFYNQRLLPAWASAEEWAKKYQASCKDPKVLNSINKQYTGKAALPPPSSAVVARAVEEAMLWARQVDGMVTRRSRLARKKKRGLSIALVDKMIVYAPRPASFGPYATSQTATLSQPVAEMAALRDGSVCAVCGKTDDPQLIVLCDGCDEEFHIGCLTPPLATVPEGDWFCSNCMEDRAYLYDHCSWGDSGKTLCKLAEKHGKSIGGGNGTLSVRQWEDNDEVLRAATMKAIQMGYAHGSTPAPPRPSQSNRKKRQTDDGNTADPGKKKRKYETKRAKGAVHFNPEDPDVQNAVSWATRHFADAAVSALEATTRGLAQALHTVVAQRDALAAEVDRLKRQIARDAAK